MLPDIHLERYNMATDGEVLWQAYLHNDHQEFFRNVPFVLRKEDIINFESICNGQLFNVIAEGEFVGFMIVVQSNLISGTCQSGLLLFKQYRHKKYGEFKLAFWCLYFLAQLLFERGNFNKISFRFLKIREDIERSFKIGMLVKEGDYKDSAFCYGKLQDEIEYALFKEVYFASKELMGE